MAIDAVYFDTNVLVLLRNEQQPFRDVCRSLKVMQIPMYVPRLVVQEVQILVKEDFENALHGARKALVKLDHFGGWQFADCLQHVACPPSESLSGFVEDLGISEIPLPDNISIAKALDEALHHRPPFEKGDKGFKDYLILEAIRSHICYHSCTKVMLISNDKIFRHPEVCQLFGNCEVIVESDHRAVLKCLEEEDNADTRLYIQDRLEKMRRVLNENFDVITSYIKKYVTVSESEFTGAGIYGLVGRLSGRAFPFEPGTRVLDILDCAPKRITDVSYRPEIRDECPETMVEAAWITVDVQYTIQVQMNNAMNLLESVRFAAEGGNQLRRVDPDHVFDSEKKNEEIYTVQIPILLRVEFITKNEQLEIHSITTELLDQDAWKALEAKDNAE